MRQAIRKIKTGYEIGYELNSKNRTPIYNRLEMREALKQQQAAGNDSFSHFSPDANILGELANTFKIFGETGAGRVRKYIHDDGEAAEFGQDPGTFTPWKDMDAGAELLFYEGLHGGYVGDDADVARHVDLYQRLRYNI